MTFSKESFLCAGVRVKSKPKKSIPRKHLNNPYASWARKSTIPKKPNRKFSRQEENALEQIAKLILEHYKNGQTT